MLWRGKWWKIGGGGTKENIWGLVELTKEFWGRVLKERKVGGHLLARIFLQF